MVRRDWFVFGVILYDKRDVLLNGDGLVVATFVESYERRTANEQDGQVEIAAGKRKRCLAEGQSGGDGNRTFTRQERL